MTCFFKPPFGLSLEYKLPFFPHIAVCPLSPKMASCIKLGGAEWQEAYLHAKHIGRAYKSVYGSKRAEIKKWDFLVWILTVLRGSVHRDDCNTEGLGNERKRAQPTETATSPVSFCQRTCILACANAHQPSLQTHTHTDTHLRARKWIWVMNNRASQKEQQRIYKRCHHAEVKSNRWNRKSVLCVGEWKKGKWNKYSVF